MGEDEILQTFTKLPTGFTCAACGLKLQREAEMHAAGLGALYDVEIGEDPASFSGIETAESVSLEDFLRCLRQRVMTCRLLRSGLGVTDRSRPHDLVIPPAVSGMPC